MRVSHSPLSHFRTRSSNAYKHMRSFLWTNSETQETDSGVDKRFYLLKSPISGNILSMAPRVSTHLLSPTKPKATAWNGSSQLKLIFADLLQITSTQQCDSIGKVLPPVSHKRTQVRSRVASSSWPLHDHGSTQVPWRLQGPSNLG